VALYSRDIGQGTPIIVLHGGPDFDHSYLLPELDRLSDSFHLIYYHQRGRGRSADRVQPRSGATVRKGDRKAEVEFHQTGHSQVRAIENRLMYETWSSPGYDLLPKLRSLRIPAVVIFGDQEFIPAATAVHITHAMPNARMVTLKDCGHFSYLERPAAVREHIDAFFRGKMKPGPLQ
jgi:pimeloyl-ACP methyl ester carboxylesterase